MICVVERAQDISVLEKTQEFNGRYHVLGGAISPIAGIGPDQLHFRELLARIRSVLRRARGQSGPRTGRVRVGLLEMDPGEDVMNDLERLLDGLCFFELVHIRLNR